MRRLFFLLAALQLAFAGLPNGWKACKQSSSDYEKCLSSQIDLAIKSLKGGHKKLGILPLDPLPYKTLLIDSSNGPVSINLELTDVTFKGLTNGNIVDVKNHDWKTLTGKMFYKEIIIKGNYKINGKVLVLPIVGNGVATIIYHNLTNVLNIKLKEVEHKGKQYFTVSHFGIDVNPKRVSFNFENLFNGNKALGDNMNIFLNENWEDIMKELKPSIGKALSQGFALVANQVFSKIPRSEIDIK